MRLLRALALPGVEQLLHVPPLLVAELEAGQETASLADVVVLDRGFEVLAHRDRLPQLSPQPAEEAHLRRFHQRGLGGSGCPRRWCQTARANGAISPPHSRIPPKMQSASTLSRPWRSQ